MPQTSRLSWIKEQVCGAVLRVRAFSDGPILTIDRTVFEMWLGRL